MNTVFVDTVGLIAIWDTADQWHAAANATFSKLLKNRCRLVTTSYVLLECGNASARKPFRGEVTALLRAFERADNLIVPNENDWETAWLDYDASKAAGAGIVDLVSMAVMSRLRITDVFSNGRWVRDAFLAELSEA